MTADRDREAFRKVASARPVRICGEIAYVDLTKGFTAIIDANDAELVSGRSWFALVSPNSKAVYAVTNVRSPSGTKCIYMHRLISPPPEGMTVDHKNGDGLDNRKKNLRHADQKQNHRNVSIRSDNASGQKGVYWNKRRKKWHARIKIDGRYICLGMFDDISLAGQAYKTAAKLLHGDFANVG